MEMQDLMSITTYCIFTATLLALLISLPSFRHRAGLPRLGIDPGLLKLWVWPARIDFLRRGRRMVYDRYQKDKFGNYVIQTLMGEQIILSPKFLPELRMLPESSLNASAALVDSVLGTYSGVDILLKDHLSSDICRAQLTKNLPQIVPQIRDELMHALSEVSQGCQNRETSSYIAYKSVYTLISHMSSRAFIGLPFCRNKEWLEPVNSYPMDVEKTKFALLFAPSFIRPWLVNLFPMKRRFSRNHERVRKLLFPSSQPQKSEEEYTFLNFLIQSSKDGDVETLTSRMILMTAAAFHNSSTAALQAVYNLCAMPEQASILRKEAEQALSETDGVWNFETINRLRHLDSFLKESQRLNSLSFLGFNRKVMSDVRLSDGMSIPSGCTIKMPSGAMALDPQYYHNASQFDSDRFFRQREEKESSPIMDYSGIEPGNLNWGNGRFSCPGRWFASVMIKLLLATLLLDYDITLDGLPTGRPENMTIDVRVLPNMRQRVSVRKRNA